MSVKKVTVPELGAVHLYKRRGSRSVRLSITNKGVIRVNMPSWLPYKSGLDFALKKSEWIKSQQIAPGPLRHGVRIGKAHRLAFLAVDDSNSTTTRTGGGEVRVYHPSHLGQEDDSVQAVAEKACVRALKSQAETLLPKRLEGLAQKHGFNYQGVKIKKLSSRWGSCSEERHITLSLYLMQLPWHMIDYVLLHELTHTRVMAHGQPFWKELGKYVTDLKTARNEIKSYRPMLFTG